MTTIALAPAERVTTAFEQRNQTVTKHEGKYKDGTITYHQTNCPTSNHQHGDAHPSLNYWEVIDDEDRSTVYFHCFSGSCTRTEILEALGIERSLVPGAPTTSYAKLPILTFDDMAQYTKLPWQFLFNLGWHDGQATFHTKEGRAYKERGVIIPYYYEDQSEFERSKIRLRIDKPAYSSKKETPRFKWTGENEDGMLLYGLPNLKLARKLDYCVICEGESDTATLQLCEVPAVGVPGASTIRSTITAERFTGISRIYVIQEKTDDAGRNFPYDVKRQLLATGYTGEVLRIPLRTLTGAKDPNELWKQIYARQQDQPELKTVIGTFYMAFQEALSQAQQMEVDTGKEGQPVQEENERVDIILQGQDWEKRDTILNTLKAWNDRKRILFVYAQKIVRIGRDKKGSATLFALDINGLRNIMTDAANFYKLNVKGEAISAPAPKAIAELILALPSSYWPFPDLKAIVEMPVVRPDGTILDVPGYDEATRLYYMQSKSMQNCKVPEYPTQEDILRAKAVLTPCLDEFCYESDADRANAYGLDLTLITRYMYSGDVQTGVINATKPGTGKGLFAHKSSILSTGRSAPLASFPEHEEEVKKVIDAKVLGGSNLIVFDNVKRKFHSASLDALTTNQGRYTLRPLGKTLNVEVETQCTVIITGNNIQMDTDQARRCFQIRLVSPVSSPDERDDFTIKDLIKHTIDNRAEIVAAYLTLVRAWFVAGCPKASNKLARSASTFASWANTIGGILENAGIMGFLENREQLRAEANIEEQQIIAFLQSWQAEFGTGEIEAKTVVGRLKLKEDFVETLPEGLLTAFSDEKKTDRSLTLILTKWLQKRVKTPYGPDNIRIETRRDPNKNTGMWRVSKPELNRSTGVAGVFEQSFAKKSGENNEKSFSEVTPNNSVDSGTPVTPVIESDASPSSAGVLEEQGKDDGRKEERNDPTSTGVAGVPELPESVEPSSYKESQDTTTLRAEADDLYRVRIVPLLQRKKSDEGMPWRGVATGFEQATVIPAEYSLRVKECLASNDVVRMRGCLEAMKSTLYDRRS